MLLARGPEDGEREPQERLHGCAVGRCRVVGHGGDGLLAAMRSDQPSPTSAWVTCTGTRTERRHARSG